MLSGQRRRRCCLRACCEHEGGEGKHRGTRAVEYGADSRSAHDQFARLLFRQPLALGVNKVDEGAERPIAGPGTVRLDRRLNGSQLSAEWPGGDLLDLDQSLLSSKTWSSAPFTTTSKDLVARFPLASVRISNPRWAWCLAARVDSLDMHPSGLGGLSLGWEGVLGQG